MAKGPFDKHEIVITCPGCGEQTAKSVRWLKAHDEFECPGCGRPVGLEREKLLAGVKGADQQMAKFRKTLGKFGKGRK
jgi:predicted RNA-binding Zn-ribbon protein involved in translation (DUF1610 family)